MVTAEIAVGLLSLVLIMVGIGFALGALTVQVRCSEAAAEIARQVARQDEAAAELAQQRVPKGAVIDIGRTAAVVSVEVTVRYQPFEAIPAITISAGSQVGSEPGTVTGGITTRRAAAGRPDAARCEPIDERGAGTMLIAAVMLVTLLLGSALMIVSGYRAAAVRVRAAADSVAMSGALAATAGQDGCAAVVAAAPANRVELEECSQVGDALDLVVSVRVSAEVGMKVAGLPTTVEAIAHAGALTTAEPP